MAEEPGQQIKIEVRWPPNTYAGARPANIFVVTDNGEQVFMSFGFLPPPPNIGELVQQGQSQGQNLRYEVDESTAFVMSRQTLVTVHRDLTKFLKQNSHIYGDLQTTDDADASEG